MNGPQLIEYIIENDGIVKGQTFDHTISLNFKPQIERLRKERIGGVFFENCVFNSPLAVNFLESGNITFTKCEFVSNGTARLTQCKLDLLEFEGCDFTNLTIGDSEIENIEFRNCSASKRLRIVDVVGDYLQFRGDIKIPYQFIHLKLPQMNDIHFLNDNVIDTLQLSDLKNLDVQAPVYNISIHGYKYGNVNFETKFVKGQSGKNRIRDLNFSHTNFEGFFTFQDLHFEHATLINLNSNSGTVRFMEVSFDTVVFEELSINKMYWHHITFNKPPSIAKCDLSGLRFAFINWKGGKHIKDSYLNEKLPWFARFREVESDKEFDVEEIEYERDTYRQFKAAAIANHNHVEALDFYRLEMRLLWKEYRVTGGNSWQDFVLVFINRWSSDFGQKWFLPLFWLFLFHAILFSCIWNWDYLGNHLTGDEEFREFWTLLLPTHKIPEYINTGFGMFTDTLMRLSSGFFIYHIIRASRKFARV